MGLTESFTPHETVRGPRRPAPDLPHLPGPPSSAWSSPRNDREPWRRHVVSAFSISPDLATAKLENKIRREINTRYLDEDEDGDLRLTQPVTRFRVSHRLSEDETESRPYSRSTVVPSIKRPSSPCSRTTRAGRPISSWVIPIRAAVPQQKPRHACRGLRFRRAIIRAHAASLAGPHPWPATRLRGP